MVYNDAVGVTQLITLTTWPTISFNQNSDIQKVVLYKCDFKIAAFFNEHYKNSLDQLGKKNLIRRGR